MYFLIIFFCNINNNENTQGLKTAPVVGTDETGAAVGKHLHWNWIQTRTGHGDSSI